MRLPVGELVAVLPVVLCVPNTRNLVSPAPLCAMASEASSTLPLPRHLFSAGFGAGAGWEVSEIWLPHC